MKEEILDLFTIDKTARERRQKNLEILLGFAKGEDERLLQKKNIWMLMCLMDAAAMLSWSCRSAEEWNALSRHIVRVEKTFSGSEAAVFPQLAAAEAAALLPGFYFQGRTRTDKDYAEALERLLAPLPKEYRDERVQSFFQMNAIVKKLMGGEKLTAEETQILRSFTDSIAGAVTHSLGFFMPNPASATRFDEEHPMREWIASKYVFALKEMWDNRTYPEFMSRFSGIGQEPFGLGDIGAAGHA